VRVESLHLDLARAEAQAICALLRRLEESERLSPVVWQDWQEDADRLVLQDVRAALEQSMADGSGDPRLEMTRSRALVLGDWLWRMGQSDDLAPLLAEDGSEQSALWSLEVWLELPLFSENSDKNYSDLVKTARSRVLTDHA
jgi:hypothetical protein